MGVERKGWTKPLIFIDLNSLPAVAVNCGNRKVIGNEKWYTTSLEILKDLVIQVGNNDKMETNLKSITSYIISSNKGYNWEVNTIMKIGVYLLNNDNGDNSSNSKYNSNTYE